MDVLPSIDTLGSVSKSDLGTATVMSDSSTSKFPQCSLDYTSGSSVEQSTIPYGNTTSHLDESDSRNRSLQPKIRPTRTRKAPERYGDYVMFQQSVDGGNPSTTDKFEIFV